MASYSEFVASGSTPSVGELNIPGERPVGIGFAGVRSQREEEDDIDDGYSGSRHQQSPTARLTEAIADMAATMRGSSNEVHLVWGTRDNSMQDCVTKLLAMESFDNHSNLYLFAVDLFSTAVNRDAFMSQPDDDHKMRWLLY